MVQEIKYNGYSALPSDYECQDGDLAVAINIIPEDEALKPFPKPATVFTIGDNDSVIYVHRTPEFTHYIILRYENDTSPVLYWADSNTPDSLHLMYGGLVNPAANTDSFDLTVEAIGNVLYVSYWQNYMSEQYSQSLYFLWNSPDYDTLSNLPFPCIEFTLQNKTESQSCTRTIDVSSVDAHTVRAFMDGGLAQGNLLNMASDAAWGVLLSRIAEITDANYFYQPFFIRYALRLFDGTHTLHSAPVLISPSTTVPLMMGKVEKETDWGSDITLSFSTVFPYGKLAYRILSPDLDAFEKWKSVITHIDIFISSPIYMYDQSKQIERYQNSLIFGSKKLRYKHLDGAESKINIDTNSSYWIIPERDKEDIENDICECSTFFLIASLDIEDIIKAESESDNDDNSVPNRPSTTPSSPDNGSAHVSFKDVPMDDGCLKSLETRETLKDEYNTHCVKFAKFAHAYNNRLNLANVDRLLFPGYPIRSMVQFRNPSASSGYIQANLNYSLVRTKKNGVDHDVHYLPDVNPNETDIDSAPDMIDALDECFPRFLFYPDPDAYQIEIYSRWNADGSTISRKYTVPLKRHKTLNGAYYFRGLGYDADIPSYKDRDTCVVPALNGSPFVNEYGKIYTSNVNNPFIFDVTNIYTIGIGEIRGISTAAKALSQGQFGQFPLYAFTTEGIWALEVSSTGTYTAKQPISRDVCLSSDSITQLDNAVLFASDRGIMLISGSTVQCISESLNTEDLFNIAYLPRCDKLINIYNGNANEEEQITLADITLLPFSEFLAGCRMVYDYTNQHIIVYNPAVRYAYVYSLKSQGWGMMLSDIVGNIKSYPESFAMTSDNRLVDFSKTTSGRSRSLIVTRPFKLGSPDIFKTVDTVIQRGHFHSSHVKQILYASNDLLNWHIVWSSTDRYIRGFSGSPYKFFRLALVCDFDKSESLYGFSVQFTPRMTDQLR